MYVCVFLVYIVICNSSSPTNLFLLVYINTTGPNPSLALVHTETLGEYYIVVDFKLQKLYLMTYIIRVLFYN